MRETIRETDRAIDLVRADHETSVARFQATRHWKTLRGRAGKLQDKARFALSEDRADLAKALSAGTSGTVRVRAIFRAFGSALMAFILGWAALAAGLIGGNIPTLIGAGCCSLVLGWVALRSARMAFGRTRPSLAESNPTPGTANSGSRQDPRANNGNPPRHAGTSTPRGRSTICYDRRKLFLRAAKLLPVCAVLAASLRFNTHSSLLVSLVVLAVLGCALLAVAVTLLRGAGKDLTAISWDNHQIRLRTLTSSRQVTWQSVESVRIRRSVVRLWGLIPVSTSYHLVFRLRRKGWSSKVTIPVSVLTIRPNEAEELVRRGAFRPASLAAAAGAGSRPIYGRREMAEQPHLGAREPNVASALDAVERTRAFGPYGRTTIPPRVFGRKVT